MSHTAGMEHRYSPEVSRPYHSNLHSTFTFRHFTKLWFSSFGFSMDSMHLQSPLIHPYPLSKLWMHAPPTSLFALSCSWRLLVSLFNAGACKSRCRLTTDLKSFQVQGLLCVISCGQHHVTLCGVPGRHCCESPPRHNYDMHLGSRASACNSRIL